MEATISYSGLYWGYRGIKLKKMETTLMGILSYIGLFRDDEKWKLQGF